MTNKFCEQDIVAIIASLARQEYAKYSPLALTFPDLPIFPRISWQDAGLTTSMLAQVAVQANAMFGTESPPPKITDSCNNYCSTLWNTWQQGAREITFLSSGSTGAPKACIHSEEMLIQEAQALVETLPRPRVELALVMAPLHHVYGFMFGCLVPRLLGLPVSMLLPLPTVVADRLEKDQKALWLVGIPLVWQQMCSLPSFRPFNANHVLLSAGSPLDDSVLAALSCHGLTCFDIYGASETGAVGWRASADASFALFPHWRRDVNCLRRRLPCGQDQKVPLMDALRWGSDGRFLPVGRVDDAVQVGGQNVYPSRVEAVLKEVVGVRECVVRLMRPEEGFRLKAFVVAKEKADKQAVREALRMHAQRFLHEHERPGSYAFGHKLPLNAMGKIADW